MNNIFQQLDYWTQKNPHKLLYAFLDIDGNITEQYTYLSFKQRVNIIAANLQQQNEFEAGDRILLAYPPGLEMIAAFFACAKIGLIPVPVYPPTAHGFEAALSKTTFIAKDCQAKAVLTSQAYYWSFKLNLSRNQLANFSFKKAYLSKLKWMITQKFKQLPNQQVIGRSSEILFLQYTSGSTSHPKGVMVTHENILHNCDMVLDFMPTGVSWLPQYHDMGLIGYYLFIALKGGTTYGFSPMDFIQRPALWLETISKYRANATSAPNFAYEYCLRPQKIPLAIVENLDLRSLKVLMIAAEPVNAIVYQDFLAKFKPRGLNPQSFSVAYGLAEFTLAVTNFGKKTQSSFDISQQQSTVMSCGKPLGDTIIKVVDTNKKTVLKDGMVGEIWIDGNSKCLGYWNKPDLTKAVFQANVLNPNDSKKYLRTGDMGFMHQGELYICGRQKDMLIVRGLNYYPQDFENLIISNFKSIRKGGIVAFGIKENEEEQLVIIAELKKNYSLPDFSKIVAKIKLFAAVEIAKIIVTTPRSIPKTSSGKRARHLAKQQYLNHEFTILAKYAPAEKINIAKNSSTSTCPFKHLKIQYGLQGNELQSLNQIGIGSLDLAILLQEIQDLLIREGAPSLAQQIDLRLLQEISVGELFNLAAQIKTASKPTIALFQKKLAALQKEHQTAEQQRMLADTFLTFDPANLPQSAQETSRSNTILLTGGTGFLGPFILKNLLEQTDATLYVLIRAKDGVHGLQRLKESLGTTGFITPTLMQAFDERVLPICGDLALPNLGLTIETWRFLAQQITTIYHNGAMVNYLFNYEKMRPVNVSATHELVRLAMEERPKVFNHISTTFIFGWAAKKVLFESDSNANMDLLNFGYSQSKWVSEQIIKNAMQAGLQARIFRPALIAPATNGQGCHNLDITIRLFAFMIHHGISTNALNQVSLLPVDIVANNLVAIANMNQTINQYFHLTKDEYMTMGDVTNMITQLIGQPFEQYSIPDFVEKMQILCTQQDLLFPLLDFFIHSAEYIEKMEFKRYDNANYQTARNASSEGLSDPTLEEIVAGMLRFMEEKKIIPISMVTC